MEKKALKEHPSLYLYHQILISTPKVSNIDQKMISNNIKKHCLEDILRL